MCVRACVRVCLACVRACVCGVKSAVYTIDQVVVLCVCVCVHWDEKKGGNRSYTCTGCWVRDGIVCVAYLADMLICTNIFWATNSSRELSSSKSAA